jgi:outer membrane protein
MPNLSIRPLLIGALLTASVAILSTALAQAPAARATRVGFVNPDRILRESLPARQARLKIEAEFASRQKEIDTALQKNQQVSDAYQKDAPGLSEAERSRRQLEVINQDRFLQRLQRAYNEDVNSRKSQELSNLQDLASKAIKKIASTEGYDLILQEASYFNPRVDITDRVIQELANNAR